MKENKYKEALFNALLQAIATGNYKSKELELLMIVADKYIDKALAPNENRVSLEDK